MYYFFIILLLFVDTEVTSALGNKRSQVKTAAVCLCGRATPFQSCCHMEALCFALVAHRKFSSMGSRSGKAVRSTYSQAEIQKWLIETEFLLFLCCLCVVNRIRRRRFTLEKFLMATLLARFFGWASYICALLPFFKKKKYVRAGCQWDRCAIRDGAAWPPLNTWQWHDLLAASWTQQVQLDEEAEWRQDEVDTAGHLGRRTPIYHSRQSSSDANGLSVLSPCMMNFDPV